MAWKITGFMHPTGLTREFRNLHGPLPVKVWVRVAGEKIARFRNRPTNGLVRGPFDENDQARKAIEYARWLAARDGKVLPEEGSVSALWAAVYVPGKSKPERRVYAVSFSSRKHRESGWLIQIPNWDWTPRQPVEIVDHEELLAA